ncbi:MAG: iron-sulfur cluster carrier protein MrpORP [Planctomycetota bacterium]
MSQTRMVPATFGPLRAANGNARITGPCGDTMEFWIFAEEGKVWEIRYTTDGCGHSIMSGAAATRLAEGVTLERAAAISQDDVLAAVGGLPEESHHCALLAANTLKAAVADYRSKHEKKNSECGTCERDSCDAKTARRDERPEELEERQALRRRLCRIGHKVIVMSGKGGVGKSTVAVNLAVSLMLAGKRVGLLDVDIHGPSVPRMLGLEGTPVQAELGVMIPLEVGTLRVMSIGFLLRDRDDAVIWRGPMKMGVIEQFLRDVEWGDLDVLVVDAPPGTGDEPLSVCQLIGDADGAVIVTTPQEVALAAVRKSITFCRQLKLPVLGVVENMSGFVCPKCGTLTDVFKAGGGERMAGEMKVPFLARIPIDPAIGESCDSGRPYVNAYARSETAKAFGRIVRPILDLVSTDVKPVVAVAAAATQKKEGLMRFAIPVADGKLTMHFGHCEKFALIDVDAKTKKIVKQEEVDAPEHQPGLLPRWLAERNVNVVIAGGMGSRAQNLFAENKIKVVVGAPAETTDKLVADYLAGTLKTGGNVCDH